VIGLFARDADALRPLNELLKVEIPMRVRPPGVIASYSNHGTALAGLAVADVSGMSWEDYVQKRIIDPLGMEHTLVRQPAKDKLPADVSKGYKWEGGRFKEQAFEYVPLAPAGCISMSGSDAAKFMLAHLHDGALGDRRILKPETAQLMRQPLFRHDPKTSAMCYGFWEEQKHGLRIVGHGGDTMWFHSLLQLIPEKKVGLFVSYNTDTSAGQRGYLWEAFLRRYFPVDDPAKVTVASGSKERAQRVAGEYVVTRYSQSTVAKLSALMSIMRVSVDKDDTITVHMGLGGEARRYVEVEPLVYREVNGAERIVFQEDKNGKVVYLFPANAPAFSAERRDWFDSSPAHLGLAGGSLLILSSAFLFWPALAFAGRGLKSPNIKRTWFSALLSCTAWLTSIACLGFVIGLIVELSEPEEIVFGLPKPLKIILAASQVCAGLSLLTLLGSLIAWKNSYWRLTGRLHYTLVALACIGFVWFLYYWNLLALGFTGIW
jgi:hypothetical protein